MTHPQRNREEQGSSFTITQFALGSPLHFEPALGSQELDDMINNYVPGSAKSQQKRAQVVLEFLNSIDALSYAHPVSIRYHVPQVLTPQMMPRHSSMPSLNTPSAGACCDISTVKEETLSTSKSTGSLKRSRDEVATPNATSAKRLPGFSIMTRDGIDITDLASRGPKTKEQRDHAALMRKLKACSACKKSKQRCDPSHHRLAHSALSTPTSATPSNRSARLSFVSSAGKSRGSISPQSSLGESFSQSPTQGFVDRAIAQTGQSFPPCPTAKPSLSPSDFTLPENLLIDSELSALPMRNFDPELFQFADMELDSWNADFTAFPTANNHNDWSSHEDIFLPNYGYRISSVPQGGSSSEEIRSSSLPQVTTYVEHVLPRQDQDQDQLARQFGQLVRDTVYPDPHGVEFDVDQWLHSTTDLEHCKDSRYQRDGSGAAGGHRNMLTQDLSQRGLQNQIILRDQDYILYPDSPQFEWGLEPHQIFRDIGNKEWLQCKEAASEMSKQSVEASPYEKDPRGPASAAVRIPGSNYHASGAQLTQLLEMAPPYQYLPSPSPLDSSEDVKGTSVSSCNLSEAEGTAYDSQDSVSQCWTKSNYAQSRHRHFNSAQLNVVQRQSNGSVLGNDEVDGYYSIVRLTSLSPGQPQSLRSVITADVNVGFQSLSDQCNEAQFARPQGSPSELPTPDIQNHTMNFFDDQQAQQTLINRDPHTVLVDPQDWEYFWRKCDLRRAGLLGVSVEGHHASRLHVSSHDMCRVQAIVDDVFDAFESETREQSWRSTISSGLPSEDGRKSVSVETLTQQSLVLNRGNSQQQNDTSLLEGRDSHQWQQEYSLTSSRTMAIWEKRTISIITLCMLMTISLLWTTSLLMTACNNPSVGLLAMQGTETIPHFWTETGFSILNSQDDMRPVSFEQDHGSPRPSDPGPGPDHTPSKADFLYSGSDQFKDTELNHLVKSGPESEPNWADDSSISENSPCQWIQQPTPSPTFSSLSITPALIMASSARQCTTTWTTHLPPKQTSQAKEAYLPVTLQSQGQSSFRSPSSRIITNLRRTWSRRFNIGHLAMRITSLNIL